MQSLLFFTLEGLGDSVLNLPSFSLLKRHYDVEVVAFNNGTAQFYRTLHPKVTGINSKADLLTLAWSKRAENAFICYPTWKKELAVAALNRSANKIFLVPQDRIVAKLRWPHRLTAAPDSHQIESNQMLLESLFPDQRRPLTKREIFAAEFLSKPHGALAIHPTASTPTKYYPVAFWEQILAGVRSRFAKIKIFCGANPAEVQFCESLLARLGRRDGIEILSGLPFPALVRALDASDYFLGNDSALMHLSALLEKPMTALWSFGDYRLSYPYVNGAKVYIPRETLEARDFGYPKHAPAFLQRASAQKVLDLISNRQSARPDLEFKPRFRDAVPFFSY